MSMWKMGMTSLCVASLLVQSWAWAATPHAHPTELLRTMGKNLDSGMSISDAMAAQVNDFGSVSLEEWKSFFSSRLSAEQFKDLERQTERARVELSLVSADDTDSIRQILMSTYTPFFSLLTAQGLTWSGNQCGDVYLFVAVSGLMIAGGVTLAAAVDSPAADAGGVFIAAAGGAGLGMYFLMRALFPWGGC